MAINAYLVKKLNRPLGPETLYMYVCERDIQHVRVCVGKNVGVTKNSVCTVVLKSVQTHSLVTVPKRSTSPSVMRKTYAKCCSLGFQLI